MLEDRARGELVGTSGIAASAGFADRFYSYRSEYVVHASPALGASNRTHTLHLCHDLTGVTLLTSFYIDPAYEHTLAPQLLSRGRLLFIAEFAERFSDRIAAESPGLADDSGRCPFWDAVGRRFFDMDYPAVERLAVGRSKSFIAELMPHVADLRAAAARGGAVGDRPAAPGGRAAVLDPGGRGLRPRHLRRHLRRRAHGARAGRACSGPWRPRARCAWRHRRGGGRAVAVPRWQLAANTRREAFRAMLLPASGGEGRLCLSPEAAIALGVYTGDTLRIAPLELEGGHGKGSDASHDGGRHE